MAFQWLLNSLPSWRQSAVPRVRRKRTPPQQVRSERTGSQPSQPSQPDQLKRARAGRVTKSSSSKSTASRSRSRPRKKDSSATPPRYIYTIPAFRADQSELSSASIVTSPSGSDSSLDSEERYQPKHKIKENLREFDFDREAEIQRQQLLIKQHSGLTDLEVKLFNQISMVGLEPLLPLSWQHDFPTFPDPMFINTEDPDAPVPFLCESRGSEYAAIRALKTLISLGTRARNRRQCRLRPEPTIANQIQAYYRWAEHDALLHTRDYIPALIVEEQKPGDTNYDVVDHAEARLQKLAKRYRARYDESANLRIADSKPARKGKGKGDRATKERARKLEQQNISFRTFPPLRDPKTNIDITPRTIEPANPPNKPLNRYTPILYGILIWHTIIKFVSYDTGRVIVSGKPGQKGYREDWSQVTAAHVADFDFSEEEPDVWNALSLASMVVWVRDQLAQDGWEWGEGGMWEEGDPDM